VALREIPDVVERVRGHARPGKRGLADQSVPQDRVDHIRADQRIPQPGKLWAVGQVRQAEVQAPQRHHLAGVAGGDRRETVLPRKDRHADPRQRLTITGRVEADESRKRTGAGAQPPDGHPLGL
jgi:hypothetical protein